MVPIIKKCCNPDCKHEYQDERYGLKMRVHNPLKGDTHTLYRCTVCEKVPLLHPVKYKGRAYV